VVKVKYTEQFFTENHESGVVLSLIWFKESKVYIINSPSLDLSGYGKNFDEAMKSFRITLEEFLRYTLNKGTLQTELKKHGWRAKAKKISVNNKKTGQ